MSNPTIDFLKAHYDNILNAKTFEEYKTAHLEYIKLLIDRAKDMESYKAELKELCNMSSNVKAIE